MSNTKPAMSPQELYAVLRPLQEKKGYFFNNDKDMTMSLLEQLLETKARYGYMACPCRLANGEYDKDRDIICPCTYREADVQEFGACFCGLYVSEAKSQEDVSDLFVPDRRPPDKIA